MPWEAIKRSLNDGVAKGVEKGDKSNIDAEDLSDMYASRVQIDAAIKSVLLTVELHRGLRGRWMPWSPHQTPQPHRCSAASPPGLATLNGNAASTRSGGHDEYPGAAPDRGGVTRYPSFHPHLPPRQVSVGVRPVGPSRSVREVEMTGQLITFYDNGKLPLWLRVPLVAVGFLLLAIGINLLAWHLFGIQFLPFLDPVSQPLGVVVAAVCLLFVLGLALCNTWVARLRILVEPEVSLLRELHWLGGTFRRAVPLSRVRAIEVERWMGKTECCGWRVNVRLDDHGLFYLTWFHSPQEAEAFAERLSSMLGVPLDPA
jgi:hypothetical protein